MVYFSAGNDLGEYLPSSRVSMPQWGQVRMSPSRNNGKRSWLVQKWQRQVRKFASATIRESPRVSFFGRLEFVVRASGSCFVGELICAVFQNTFRDRPDAWHYTSLRVNAYGVNTLGARGEVFGCWKAPPENVPRWGCSPRHRDDPACCPWGLPRMIRCNNICPRATGSGSGSYEDSLRSRPF